jgi:hypothetical protein
MFTCSGAQYLYLDTQPHDSMCNAYFHTKCIHIVRMALRLLIYELVTQPRIVCANVYIYTHLHQELQILTV